MGENNQLEWLAMTDFPNSLGVAGPFVGVSYSAAPLPESGVLYKC